MELSFVVAIDFTASNGDPALVGEGLGVMREYSLKLNFEIALT